MFDIKKFLAENKTTLNEARGMSLIAMGNFVDKLRGLESHLHKSQHWAKRDHDDPELAREYTTVLKLFRALRKKADELEAQLDRSQY